MPHDWKERSNPVYRVSEFAEKAGVTVRTLHHYDRLGLLKPSGRTIAGYRLYGDRDFARLQQIVTLKFIGLPLRQIKDLLDRGDLDLKSTLRMQRRLLLDKRLQVEAAIQAIEEAERSLMSGVAPDLAALKKIIEVMERQNSMDWAKKYYSEEAQAKIAERARTWTPELQARVEQDWKTLTRRGGSRNRRQSGPCRPGGTGTGATLVRAGSGLHRRRCRYPTGPEQALRRQRQLALNVHQTLQR